MILEVACFSLEDALTAKDNADRIEFCTNYSVGGLTPSLSDFLILKNDCSIPIFVMIRSNYQTFVLDQNTIKELSQSIRIFANSGASGFVFGALKIDQNKVAKVDILACKKLLEASDGLPCTFHRAFDLLPNPIESLDLLSNLGFERVLTSGGSGNAHENLETLSIMKNHSSISILPGGGIRSSHLQVFQDRQFQEIHSACCNDAEKLDNIELKRMREMCIKNAV
jgi:copper homeostasis protein